MVETSGAGLSRVDEGERAFDRVLKGGRVIDPRNGIDAVMDIGIRDGRIAAVAERLDAGAAAVDDMAGHIVTPGLIDIHTHVYHKATSLSVDPDPVARRSAVTTLVDAGSAGAGNLEGLKDFVAARSAFNLLAYVNISFPGIFAFDKAFSVGEATVRDLLNVGRCVEAVEANKDFVVGIKVRIGDKTSGDVGLEALDRAIAAAERTGLPVMTHIGGPPPSYEDILARMRPGDILTHCFRPAPNAPVDGERLVLPALREARERGVLFDIGHGMGAFGFDSAEAALADGFPPDMISSDVHVMSIKGPAYDLLHTMSKLMCCGVGVTDVIAMVTDAPAKAMSRDHIGHLGVGAAADISVLDLVEVAVPFVDVIGHRREGMKLLKPHALYVAGQPEAVAPRPFEPDAA
ncbi:MAG: amidohydrolase/deacetylase family metallohydrolase [Chelatococcus sp.]|uniref:amidohydrolase/deacetylase family metallohydrolase n=1 Tax=Chelatococcus sp. TaxID=1953771 RepID=UPI0025B82683|nr:amidohydrolase/deacetylase family metallohydrolase [Chelatococcus sp.]MBX3540111.1 amidohydrolase/deacetylase family metallohydrolase [Chelatococcus sp.]